MVGRAPGPGARMRPPGVAPACLRPGARRGTAWCRTMGVFAVAASAVFHNRTTRLVVVSMVVLLGRWALRGAPMCLVKVRGQ